MIKLAAKFNWSIQYRMYAWLALTMGALLGIGLGLIQPTLHRLETQTNTIVKTLSDNTLSDATATTIIHAKQDEVQLQNDLIDLQTAFIQEQNPLPYLTQLETLANQRNVVLDFDVKETSDATLPLGEPKPIVTIVMITGSWDNVTSFINDMMTEPIYFITSKVELAAPSNKNGEISAILTGNTYWQ